MYIYMYYSIKWAIKKQKKEVRGEWGRSISNNLRLAKIIFFFGARGCGVNSFRQENGQICQFIKDRDGDIVSG